MQIEFPDFSAPIPQSILEQPWKKLEHALARQSISKDINFIWPILAIGDSLIANQLYSQKPLAYTNDAIAKIQENPPFQNCKDGLILNIGTARYFPPLEHISFDLIGKAADFSIRNALEPQRLIKGFNLGKELIKDKRNKLVYLSDVGAGNDLCAESVLHFLYRTNTLPEAIKAAKSAASNDVQHPFSVVEKYGNYQIPFFIGLLMRGIENECYFILEGWSATTAYAIITIMFPRAAEFCSLASPLPSAVLQEVYKQQGWSFLEKENPNHERASFFDGIMKKIGLD